MRTQDSEDGKAEVEENSTVESEIEDKKHKSFPIKKSSQNKRPSKWINKNICKKRKIDDDSDNSHPRRSSRLQKKKKLNAVPNKLFGIITQIYIQI